MLDFPLIAGNIALRWSAGRIHNGFYKHLAPLEPEQYWVAAESTHRELLQTMTRRQM